MFKTVSTSLKPRLTDENKAKRVAFALTFVDKTILKFQPMYDYVHADDKWFYITKTKQNIIKCSTRKGSIARLKARALSILGM